MKDADTIDEPLKTPIKSKVKLSVASGARGTAVTVSGVGLGKGGATVFLVTGHCPDQGDRRQADRSPSWRLCKRKTLNRHRSMICPIRYGTAKKKTSTP